jgi:hypothetical protein
VRFFPWFDLAILGLAFLIWWLAEAINRLDDEPKD